MGFRMINPKRMKKIRTPGGQEVLRKLQEFLDDSCGKTAEFLCRFWKNQQNAITYKELRQAVLAGTISMETLRLWQQDYSILVANRFRSVWEEAMRAGSVSQPVMHGKGFEFDMQTPGIMHWLWNRGGEFVTSCTEEQKAAVSALLSKKMIEGHTVDELARMIRPCIGLTEGQAKANARYYDSIVANLKKENPRMKPESIQKKAQDAAAKYAERQHRQRAMTIAQTESAFAYNRGADEGIRQAQSQGLLGQVMKRWSTSGDDAVCSICQGLEGVELGLDEGFDFKGRLLFAEQNLMPPAHPRCACAVEYVEVEGTVFRQESFAEYEQNDFTNIVEDDIIMPYRFNTEDDPIREIIGAAEESHPQELKQIVDDLKAAGVVIRRRDGAMGYTPATFPGSPGEFLIEHGASYSAWLHEYKHFCDDRYDGYLGMRVFMDIEKCIQREIDAYEVEIEFARQYNRQDIVRRLQELRDREIAKYG